MTPEWFRDCDSRYESWCASHPKGYIVNANYKPRPRYLFLHKVGCPSFDGKTNFTGPGYSKLCSDSIDELRATVQRDVGAKDFSHLCKLCFPSKGLHAERGEA